MTAPSAPTERAPSGLAEVLRERRPEILERWRNAARGHIDGDRSTDRFPSALPALLERLQKDVERAERGERLADDPAVKAHANERLSQGAGLEEVVEDYVRLRKAIVAVWRPAGDVRDLTELERLADAFDAAIAAAARRYGEARSLARGRLEGELFGERLRVAGLLEERERQRARAELLSEASRRLFSSLDFAQTLEVVTGLAVPRVADWCGVYLVDEQGELVPAAVHHADPEKAALAREAIQRYVPRKGAPYGSAHVIATGEPELLEVLTPEMFEQVATEPTHVELLLRLGLHSYMGVPLKAHGRTIGVLVFVNAERDASFSREDLGLAEELAGRCALAIENVRLYGEEQRSRRVLEGLISGMMDAVLVADRRGRFFQVNSASERLFERRREELLLPAPDFSRLLDMHESDDRPVTTSITYEALQGHTVGPVERWIPRKDGSRRWLRLAATPILDEEGCVEGAVVVCGDITASKELQRERELGEAEARFLSESTRLLVESLDTETTLHQVASLAVPLLGDLCMLVLLDENGAISRVVTEGADREAAAAFERVSQRYSFDLSGGNPAAEVLKSGRAVVVEQVTPEVLRAVFPAPEAARAVEQLGLASFAGFPLVARGRTFGGMGFFGIGRTRALGERERRIAGELASRCALALDNARLYREAQEAIRIREQVLAVVSHDLKNPLAAVQMNAQLLKRSLGAEGGRALRTAETIYRASERMTRMLNDLADLRSIQRGRLAVERRPGHLVGILEEAREETSAIASEHEVTVRCVFEEALPVVVCDRQRLLQVLSNLVSNAAKASPPGSVVEIGARPLGDGAAREVLVWVKDQGRGISARDLPHLFEPYWRGQDASYKGVGLGLAISRGIIQAHDGRIWVESEPGRGATFFFTLPAERAEAGGGR